MRTLSIIAGTVLLAPTAATLWFRRATLEADEEKQRAIWAGFCKFIKLIQISVVASWWIIWDIASESAMSLENWRFWSPPIASLGIFLLLCSNVDKTLLKLKWTILDSVRQVSWRIVSFVIPLLMLAAGYDLILDKRLRGIAWVLAAAVVSGVGTAFLRRAEGWKLRELKAGEYRSRALRVARGMGVTLRKVFVVPAGKGHLTNAYGLSDAIALTDSLGQHLNDPQMEFVVAHEVAHVKLRHGLKHLISTVAIFAVTALALFLLSSQTKHLRPLFQVIAIFAPLVVHYYCSRRFEYSADREAVEFTEAPEIAVQTLTTLDESHGLPAATDAFVELFMTHPTFAHRVRAIVNHTPNTTRTSCPSP